MRLLQCCITVNAIKYACNVFIPGSELQKPPEPPNVPGGAFKIDGQWLDTEITGERPGFFMREYLCEFEPFTDLELEVKKKEKN